MKYILHNVTAVLFIQTLGFFHRLNSLTMQKKAGRQYYPVLLYYSYAVHNESLTVESKVWPITNYSEN